MMAAMIMTVMMMMVVENVSVLVEAAGESLNMFFRIDFFMTLLQLSRTYKTTCISHQIGNNFPFVYYILSFMVLRKVV